MFSQSTHSMCEWHNELEFVNINMLVHKSSELKLIILFFSFFSSSFVSSSSFFFFFYFFFNLDITHNLCSL